MNAEIFKERSAAYFDAADAAGDFYGEGALALAAGEEKLRELEAEYRLSRAAAEAEGAGELAAAQYEEWVRQQEVRAEQEKFEAQQAQKAAAAAHETAMAMLKAGAMPHGETLAAAGISDADAKSYLAAVQAAKATKSRSSGSSSSSKKKEKEEKTAQKTTDAITTYDGLSPAAKSVYTSYELQMRRSGYYYMTDRMRTNLFDAYLSGTLNRKEYSFILKSFGG